LNAAAGRSEEEETQAIYAQGAALFEQIWQFQATTLEGAQAKARALLWVHGSKAEEWDCQYSFELIEDLLAIASPDGR
jgi:hypothetical protein